MSYYNELSEEDKKAIQALTSDQQRLISDIMYKRDQKLWDHYMEVMKREVYKPVPPPCLILIASVVCGVYIVVSFVVIGVRAFFP